MKKLLSLAVIGLIALAMTVSAEAVPTTPQVAVLEHQITHDEKRIHNLEQRRAYLHRYIRHHRPPTEVHGSLTPLPTTTRSYSGGVLSDAQVTSYLLQAGFPSSTISQMLYYSHRESGNDPSAINSSSGACGLFQLFPCSGGSAWLDPATNAREAYAKYSAPTPGGGIAGFGPWGG